MVSRTPVTGGSPLSLWRRIWFSLLGGSCYRRLAQDARGVYGAFLAVALATAIAAAGVSGWSARRGLREVVALWPQVPSFSVHKGHLELGSGSAATVRVSSGGTAVVLQPGGSGDPLGQARTGLAITADMLVLRVGPTRTPDREFPLSSLGTTTFTKQALGALLQTLATTGICIAVLLDVACALLRDVVRAAVVAWTAWIALRLVGRGASWPEAWRVGLAAWSLPMIAEAAGLFVPVPGWALWLVAGVYAMTGLVPASVPG